MSFDPDFDQFRYEHQMLQSNDEVFSKVTSQWVADSVRMKYSYGFDCPILRSSNLYSL